MPWYNHILEWFLSTNKRTYTKVYTKPYGVYEENRDQFPQHINVFKGWPFSIPLLLSHYSSLVRFTGDEANFEKSPILSSLGSCAQTYTFADRVKKDKNIQN